MEYFVHDIIIKSEHRIPVTKRKLSVEYESVFSLFVFIIIETTITHMLRSNQHACNA